jgi:hypothetical protein
MIVSSAAASFSCAIRASGCANITNILGVRAVKIRSGADEQSDLQNCGEENIRARRESEQ